MVSDTVPGTGAMLFMCPPKTNSNSMTQFDPINLHKIIQHLKSCCLDILPAAFFKKVSDCMTPDLLQMVNMSVLSGVYHQTMITVVIKPLLKKNSADTSVMNNYMAISNLTILGKINEKASNDNKWLFWCFPVRFQPHHSTEMAHIKVLIEIHLKTYSAKISVFILLDLSAAFTN